MAEALALIASIVTAYVIGSFPTSYLMAKAVKGVDIRQVGSGNAGATNVLRNVGKLPGLMTLLIDALKGVLVVTVIAKFFYNFLPDFDCDTYLAVMGLTVVAGHMWSVFLGFKGGKGVATSVGVAAVLVPKILLPSFMVWVIVFALTSYVSLASIIGLISFPVFAAVIDGGLTCVSFSVAICLISIYKHKENISRLLRGEETKTNLFKKR